MTIPPARDLPEDERPPPVLGRWTSFYLLEVGVLLAQIGFYLWVGWVYR